MLLLPTRYGDNEAGQTIVLVAFCLLAIIAFAALAIDVTTLYVAHNQAQQAADAAALAGAKAFVSSGYTSGFVTQTVAQAAVTQQATWAGQQVSVGGRNLQSSEISVTYPTSTENNPVVSVNISRVGVPTFFAKIWGVTTTTISAAAKAEAYNPSGLDSTYPNIQVTNVKPFAVPNCNPNATGSPVSACGSGRSQFFDPTNDYSIVSPGSVVGQSMTLSQLNATQSPSASGNLSYYAIDLPVTTSSVSCPAPTQTSCDSINPSSPGYMETIACTNSTALSCGQTFTVDPGTGSSALGTSTRAGGMCLIHSRNPGLGNWGQDLFCNNSFPCSFPIEIDGGGNNPDPSLSNVNYISRSDSVITVPVWDGSKLCSSSASGPTCNPGTIIGFLQLGIQRMRASSSGGIAAVVLNAVGCGSTSSGRVASGSTASPVIFRLIN